MQPTRHSLIETTSHHLHTLSSKRNGRTATARAQVAMQQLRAYLFTSRRCKLRVVMYLALAGDNIQPNAIFAWPRHSDKRKLLNNFSPCACSTYAKSVHRMIAKPGGILRMDIHIAHCAITANVQRRNAAIFARHERSKCIVLGAN